MFVPSLFLLIALQFQILTPLKQICSLSQERFAMNENVIPFPVGRPSRIGHFIRVGFKYHQFEHLLAAGRVPSDSVVLEGALVGQQGELIRSLREAQIEIILDTNVAELSSLGRFDGRVRSAPWADPDGPLTVEHFRRGPNYDIIGKIARCAVRNGFTVVLAPAHMLSNSNSAWLAVDRENCISLRRKLDAEGGRAIAIDYPLMITFAALRDPIQRRALLTNLGDLPFDNLWLRISDFGSDATGLGVRRYIAAATEFLSLNKPIIADGVAGLAALGIVAFGAAGGVAHGVAELERFDARGWNNPRSRGGGGNPTRFLVPGLDRLINLHQMEQLLAAPSGRRICSCNDSSCCPNGWEDTQRNPKAHYLHQRHKQIKALSAVADLRRVQHFLDYDLADSVRFSRDAARLMIADEALKETLSIASKRLKKMSEVLQNLQTIIGDEPRSAPIERRADSLSNSARRR
jgi:hypothetical protein